MTRQKIEIHRLTTGHYTYNHPILGNFIFDSLAQAVRKAKAYDLHPVIVIQAKLA